MTRVLKFLGGGISLGFHEWSNWKAKRILKQRARASPLEKITKVAVYTAIFGDKDRLHEVRPFPGVEFFCFTDDKTLTSKSWRIILEEPSSSDPRMAAKIYKVLPIDIFPSTNSVYGWTAPTRPKSTPDTWFGNTFRIGIWPFSGIPSGTASTMK